MVLTYKWKHYEKHELKDLGDSWENGRLAWYAFRQMFMCISRAAQRTCELSVFVRLTLRFDPKGKSISKHLCV